MTRIVKQGYISCIAYSPVAMVNDFTLYGLMDSSFWFDTIKIGMDHCIYQGVTGFNRNEIVFLSLKINFDFTNSVDPDEMLHDSESCSISSGSSMFANVRI